MTSVHNIQNHNNLNLYDFIEGNRAHTVNKEETGFRVNGNVGSLLNSSKAIQKKIYDGLLFPGPGITDHSNNIIGNIHPMKNDWTMLKNSAPNTPLIYCNKQHNSELLPQYPSSLSPQYPNGLSNVLLSPDCNMQIDGMASPTLYGETTAFVNTPAVFSNPINNIGHEVQAYGIANQHGMRALGEGKYACQKLENGHNVPTLKVEQNKNGAYISKPISVHPDVPLYPAGNWPEVTNNFLNEFNDHVGRGCKNIKQ